jgi:hypothetical protein
MELEEKNRYVARLEGGGEKRILMMKLLPKTM